MRMVIGRVVSRAKKGFLVVVVVIGVTILLAACDSNLAESPIAIRREGANLVMVICTPTRVLSLEGTTRSSGVGQEWTTFLKASGPAQVGPDSVLSSSGSVAGLTASTFQNPPLNAGDQIGIQVKADDSRRDLDSGFVIGQEGLSRTRWLQTDGRETASPCPPK